MSVALTDIIRLRPYAGYVDPGLPMGIWAGFIALTGNGTGGTRLMQILFSVGGGRSGGGNLFSLEQIFINDTDNNAKTVDIDCINMDRVANTEPFRNSWVYALGAGVGSRAIRRLESTIATPYFMGIPNPGTQGSLDVKMANVDLAVARVEAQGYWWSPRSLNVDGGPRRPAMGLYPS